MTKAIIFDWTGTLFKRNEGLFDFSKEILDKLKPKYKLGLISKANLAEIDVKPEETIVVGDRATRDILPGNKLGCVTVWIQKGDRSFDSPNEETGEPDYRIDSIKELLDILK